MAEYEARMIKEMDAKYLAHLGRSQTLRGEAVIRDLPGGDAKVAALLKRAADDEYRAAEHYRKAGVALARDDREGFHRERLEADAALDDAQRTGRTLVARYGVDSALDDDPHQRRLASEEERARIARERAKQAKREQQEDDTDEPEETPMALPEDKANRAAAAAENDEGLVGDEVPNGKDESAWVEPQAAEADPEPDADPWAAVAASDTHFDEATGEGGLSETRIASEAHFEPEQTYIPEDQAPPTPPAEDEFAETADEGTGPT